MTRPQDSERLDDRVKQAIPSLFFAALHLIKPTPTAFRASTGLSYGALNNWAAGFRTPSKANAKTVVDYFAQVGVDIDLDRLTLEFDYEAARAAGANLRPLKMGATEGANTAPPKPDTKTGRPTKATKVRKD